MNCTVVVRREGVWYNMEHRQFELPMLIPGLPEGEEGLIRPYEKRPAISALAWPVLNGGRYRGGTLRREELYDDGTCIVDTNVFVCGQVKRRR